MNINKKFAIIVITIMGFIVIAVFARGPFIQRDNACVMDGLRYVMWSRCSVVLILLMCVGFIIIKQNEYNPMKIMKMNSRIHIWNVECFGAFIYALISSIIIIMLTIVYSLFLSGGVWMNWKNANSFSAIKLGMKLENTSVIEMIILCMLLLSLQGCISLWALMVSNEICNSYIWGLIVVLGIGINDMNGSWAPILYGRFMIQREQWLFMNNMEYIKIFILVCIFMLVNCVGIIFARKKEYF